MTREEEFGVSQDYLKEHFKYEDGKLYRVVGDKSKAKSNKADWAKVGSGYRRLYARGSLFSVARLIWIYHRGFIPDGMVIDHINRVRDDDRIENLRVVSIRENNMNTIKNTSGFPGVSWSESRKKWIAFIRINYKSINLDRYKTLEEAIQARRQAELKYGLEVREEFHIAI